MEREGRRRKKEREREREGGSATNRGKEEGLFLYIFTPKFDLFN